jgi:hypothetical protein
MQEDGFAADSVPDGQDKVVSATTRRRFSQRSRRQHKAWGVSSRVDGKESLARETGGSRLHSYYFRTRLPAG